MLVATRVNIMRMKVLPLVVVFVVRKNSDPSYRAQQLSKIPSQFASTPECSHRESERSEFVRSVLELSHTRLATSSFREKREFSRNPRRFSFFFFGIDSGKHWTVSFKKVLLGYLRIRCSSCLSTEHLFERYQASGGETMMISCQTPNRNTRVESNPSPFR